MIKKMLAIWSLVPLPFLNTAWTSGSSPFMECWSLAWRILSITLLVWKMGAIVWWFEQSLLVLFLRIGMRVDLFQSCGHCWVFQISWHTECSTLIVSSFRILNNSAWMLVPSLALLATVFPKAHYTSHSRMSGSRWVITPRWLSGSLRYFFVQFCIFFPSPLDLFCFYTDFIIFVLYCVHLWMKCSFDISTFLDDIFSLTLSVVFLY